MVEDREEAATGKHLLESKTTWANVLLVVLTYAWLVFSGPDTGEDAGLAAHKAELLVTAQAALNVWLRTITKEPIQPLRTKKRRVKADSRPVDNQ